MFVFSFAVFSLLAWLSIPSHSYLVEMPYLACSNNKLHLFRVIKLSY